MSEIKSVALVIDDEVQMRRLLRVSLEGEGYRVFDAETGEQGISEAASRKPDVIILDLGLPDLDGLEVVKRLELPYPLLSDKELNFVRLLKLPTFQFNSMTLIKRLTLVLDNGRIAKVFYPVFPPDQSAEQTLRWLMQNRSAI